MHSPLIINILGCPGSGRHTFAIQLASKITTHEVLAHSSLHLTSTERPNPRAWLAQAKRLNQELNEMVKNGVSVVVTNQAFLEPFLMDWDLSDLDEHEQADLFAHLATFHRNRAHLTYVVEPSSRSPLPPGSPEERWELARQESHLHVTLSEMGLTYQTLSGDLEDFESGWAHVHQDLVTHGIKIADFSHDTGKEEG